MSRQRSWLSNRMVLALVVVVVSVVVPRSVLLASAQDPEDPCIAWSTNGCDVCITHDGLTVNGRDEAIKCVFCAVVTEEYPYGSCVSYRPHAEGQKANYLADLPGDCRADGGSPWRRVYADYTCPSDEMIAEGDITVSWTTTNDNGESTSNTVSTGSDPKGTAKGGNIAAGIFAALVVMCEVGWLHYRHNLAAGAAETKTPKVLAEGSSFKDVSSGGDSSTAAPAPITSEGPAGGSPTSSPSSASSISLSSPSSSSPSSAAGTPGGFATPESIAAAAAPAGIKDKFVNRFAPVKFLVLYPTKVIVTLVLTIVGFQLSRLKTIPCDVDIRPGCVPPSGIDNAAPFVLLFGFFGIGATAAIHFFGFFLLDNAGNKPVGYPFRLHLAKISAMGGSFPDMYVLFIARKCSASAVLVFSYLLTLVDSVWSLIYIESAWNDLRTPYIDGVRFMLVMKAVMGVLALKDLIWFAIKLWMAGGGNVKCVKEGDSYTCKDDSSEDGKCGPAEVLDDHWLKIQYEKWDFDRVNPAFVDQWITLASAAKKKKEQSGGDAKSPA